MIQFLQRWPFKLVVILLFILTLTYYILFHYPLSTGKRVGNLTKISKKGRLLKTWEGTLNEGFGDKLTTPFSIRQDALAQELFNFEGKEVVIYYDEHFLGWPQDTHYNVTSWEPYHGPNAEQGKNPTVTEVAALHLLSKTVFCSFLGTLKNNPTLYQQVKDYIQQHNLYLFEQYQHCLENPSTTTAPKAD